ncbi:MAG TPA: hypothetical protein VGF30_02740, partial [Bacteroidia bacterium]
STQLAFSQDDEEDTIPKAAILEDGPPSEPPKSIHPVSIRLNGGVPNPFTSQLFRKRMIGIYEANITAAVRVGKYAYVGIGYTNALFSVSNRTKFANHTKLQMNSGFVRMGYDKYHSGKMFSSLYLNTGYTHAFYTSVVNQDKDPHNLNVLCAFLQPNYSINFFAEERMTLGFCFGYKYMLWQFDPEQINMADTDPDISRFRTSGNASYWTIGLEMYIGLGKLK